MSTLRRVIVVGAGGTNIGHHVANALAADPSFELSILSRASSKSTYPDNATIIAIPDNATHENYVRALQGQDAVVSCLGFEGKTTEKAIIDAAIEAGVKRFLPSEYGIDNTNPVSRDLSPVFQRKAETIDYLKSKEGTGLSWTAVPTGMWLDWALDPSIAFIGIDIRAHTAEIWPKEPYQMTFTTLPTAADAVRRILLNSTKTENRVVPVRNFEASTQELVALLEAAQGVKYHVKQIEGTGGLIKSMQKRWVDSREQDVGAALGLVKAGFLLPEYGSNFAQASRFTLGNELLDFPADGAKLEDVVREAVVRFS